MKPDQTASFFSFKKSRLVKTVSFFLTILILLLIFILLYFIHLRFEKQQLEELNLDFVSAIQGQTTTSVVSPENPTATPQTVVKQTVQTIKKQENTQQTTQADVSTQKEPSEILTTEEKTKDASPEPLPTKAKYMFSAEETEPSEEQTTETSAQKLITQGSTMQGLGIEGELKGRGLAYVPNLNSTCLEKGIVVIEVTVNAAGQVMRKVANYKQSTTTASCLIQEALSLTQKIQWEPHQLELMSGSVQFNFQ